MRKKYMLFGTTLLLIFPSSAFAFVPLICDLCTIGVVAGLAVSRYLGVDDSVVGVWIGACLVALIFGTCAYMEKRNIRYRFRDLSVALLFVVFTLVPFYYARVIGIPGNTLWDINSIFLDKVLVSSVMGGLVLIGASIVYQWMKKRYGVFFPFQKVAMPILALALTSLLFYFLTAR